MKNNGKVIYELLVEFDDICKENNIEYCLEDTAVRDAYLMNDIGEGVYELNVSMDAENMKKLYKVVENFSREGRIFESIINTKNKRSFCISYMNTNTLYMDLRKPNQFINKCIRINIYLRINYYDNPNARKARKLQVAWQGGVNSIEVIKKNFFACCMMKIAKTLLGEFRVGKKVFQKYISYHDKKIEYDSYRKYLERQGYNYERAIEIIKEAFLERKNGPISMKMKELSNWAEYSNVRKKIPEITVNGKKIPAFLYDEIDYIDVKGSKIPVPKEAELYLFFCLGIKKGFYINNFVPNWNILVSETISYDEFKKKNNKQLEKNKKLYKFYTKDIKTRAQIRVPIEEMYKEFEKAFFSESKEKIR